MSRDIKFRAATVPWCDKSQGWVGLSWPTGKYIGSGSKRVRQFAARYFRDEKSALEYAMRLDAEIMAGGGL